MSLEEKLKKALKAADKALGPVRKGPKLAPLETAVHAVLAPFNGPAPVRKALEALTGAFVDWNEVRVSSWKEIGHVLDSAGVREAGEKAFTLRKLLNEVFNRYNKMALDALLDAKPEDARRALEGMKEFPETAAAAVLHINLKVDALHVTPALLRISKRIGLITDDSPQKGRKDLERRVSKRIAFHYQQHMAYLASRVCLSQITLCDRCPLAKVCDTGIQTLRAAASASTKRSSPRGTASKPARKKAAPRKAAPMKTVKKKK